MCWRTPCQEIVERVGEVNIDKSSNTWERLRNRRTCKGNRTTKKLICWRIPRQEIIERVERVGEVINKLLNTGEVKIWKPLNTLKHGELGLMLKKQA